jgi:hypothetical protein
MKSPAGATESHNFGIFCRPSGAWLVLTFHPQLKLRAIFFRACGAKTFDSRAFFIGFPPFIFLLHLWPRRFNVEFTNMSNAAKDSSSANDLLKNSSLYREFQAEREEILRHKWIESEKAGRDIGFEQALTDWIIKHRSSWRKNRQAAATN